MSDGKLKIAETSDLLPGAVLREVNEDGTSPQFADSVIVKITKDAADNQILHLARPHMIVTSDGDWWDQVEEYQIPFYHLLPSHFGNKPPRSNLRIVCLDSGKPTSVLRWDY